MFSLKNLTLSFLSYVYKIWIDFIYLLLYYLTEKRCAHVTTKYILLSLRISKQQRVFHKKKTQKKKHYIFIESKIQLSFHTAPLYVHRLQFSFFFVYVLRVNIIYIVHVHMSPTLSPRTSYLWVVSYNRNSLL